MERDEEIISTKSLLRSLQDDSTSFNCNIATMEEALEKKVMFAFM